jgi:BASS family bile acid:Na+ symporter
VCATGFRGENVLISPLLLLNLFVVIVMFSIGLCVSGGELLDILRKRALLVRALLANCILIPAIGFLLVRIFPLTPDASVGILLLAAIPGTPIALQFTRQAKTRLAFGAAMTFVLSLVSVAMTPLAVEVIPQTAQRNQRPMLLLIFLMWDTRLVRREAFNAIRGRGTILAMLLLLLLSMLIGWLIGGPDPESRRVLATSTGMRSVIVVLYVARYCFPGTNVYMIPIVYISLMVPTNLLFHLAFTGWHKLRPAPEM